MPVFHLDIEAFLTSVERVRDPALERRPLVIALPRQRATVMAASPEAKQAGVQRDMPVERVQRHFPGMQVIPPDFALYHRANKSVLDVVSRFSPIVEPVAFGHVALDMTGMRALYGNLNDAAASLGRELKTRTRLKGTVGIAANKLVSTIAAKETQINGAEQYEVPQEEERRFLAPLPCRALPEWEDAGVRRLLFELNLRHIEQIQAIPRDIFSFALGKQGTGLHKHAMGVDPRPVTPPDRTPRLEEVHRFEPDTNDDDVLRAVIYRLVEKLCFRLRAKGLTASAASISLRYSDQVSRLRRFRFTPGHDDHLIYQHLMEGFTRLCDRRRRVNRIVLYLEKLSDEACRQTSLFTQPKPTRVLPRLDHIRARFGEDAVRLGRTLRAV